MTRLSLWSMDIYYSHVMILCVLRGFPRAQNGMSGMLLLFVGTFLCSAVFAALLGAVKKRLRARKGR